VTRERRFRLEAGAATFLTALIRPLPRALVLAAGRVLGGLYARFDRRHVAVAMDNLRHAFPDWDEARLLLTAHGVYRHFGSVILDLLWMQDRTREEILGIVSFAGREHVAAALEPGRGFICATGHLGNWEAHAVAHGFGFATAAVVGRPLDNPALDARLVRLRSSSGNAAISKRRALPDILRFLRANKAVAILMDQNVQEDGGIFVTFFGRPASTTPVAAAIAAKTGCAIVPGHSELQPDGRYLVTYEAPLFLEKGGDRRADIARLTQELTERIEHWVREHPEQWLWIHRRWKTQPKTEAR
jgi:Kdo2-lipid IVA lauroyltransferase/acyltransferase